MSNPERLNERALDSAYITHVNKLFEVLMKDSGPSEEAYHRFKNGIDKLKEVLDRVKKESHTNGNSRELS